MSVFYNIFMTMVSLLQNMRSLFYATSEVVESSYNLSYLITEAFFRPVCTFLPNIIYILWISMFRGHYAHFVDISAFSGYYPHIVNIVDISALRGYYLYW